VKLQSIQAHGLIAVGFYLLHRYQMEQLYRWIVSI